MKMYTIVFAPQTAVITKNNYCFTSLDLKCTVFSLKDACSLFSRPISTIVDDVRNKTIVHNATSLVLVFRSVLLFVVVLCCCVCMGCLYIAHTKTASIPLGTHLLFSKQFDSQI